MPFTTFQKPDSDAPVKIDKLETETTSLNGENSTVKSRAFELQEENARLKK